MKTSNEIATAKQHNTFAVTTMWAEGERHTIRYIAEHPYETVVGPQFQSKKALRDFAATHEINIFSWR